MDNVSKYAPPPGYYGYTQAREPSVFLVDAIRLLSPKRRTALDFGCGAGSETRLLAKEGFTITAVDGNDEARDYIAKIPNQDRITFVRSAFEEFSFKSYDLINSSRSLPFINKANFTDVMARLVRSIKPGGIFVGEFYGINDEWNKLGETMTFLSKNEVKGLLESMRVIKFLEKEEDGQIANGKVKHWHRFYVVAQKNRSH